MALRQEFEKAIKDITWRKEHGTKSLSTYGLHKVISGPRRSGKTTLAREYAQALSDKGLVANKEPVRFGWLDSPRRDEIDRIFEAGKSGVMIFDDMERHPPGYSRLDYPTGFYGERTGPGVVNPAFGEIQHILQRLALHVEDGGVAIFVGTPDYLNEFANLVKFDGPLTARIGDLREFVTTERAFSTQEMNDFQSTRSITTPKM